MNTQETGILYVVLILPSLFALILVTEGIHKILKKESGWISLFLGLAFLGIIIYAYFAFFK